MDELEDIANIILDQAQSILDELESAIDSYNGSAYVFNIEQEFTDEIGSIVELIQEQTTAVRQSVLEKLQDEFGEDWTDANAELIESDQSEATEFFIVRALQESAEQIQKTNIARQIVSDEERDETREKDAVSATTLLGVVALAEVFMSSAIFSREIALENGRSYFRYDTIGDELVRGEHASRDGKIFVYGRERVIDDIPRAAFRCRCNDFPLTLDEVLELEPSDFFYPEDYPAEVENMSDNGSMQFRVVNNIDYDGFVGDWWEGNDFESFKRKVSMELEEDINKALEINITSWGGFADDGLAAYSFLKSLPNPVLVYVYGYAGSAATMFLCAADIVSADTSDLFLVHEASGFGFGKKDDMEEAASNLELYNQSIASAYQYKTGKSLDDIFELMADDKLISAQEALDFGLVDILR